MNKLIHFRCINKEEETLLKQVSNTFADSPFLKGKVPPDRITLSDPNVLPEVSEKKNRYRTK